MKKVIQTAGAPAPIGPYSQAIATGGLVFLSGQTPLDPATGAMVEGDVQAQTERVMQNLKAVLEAAGVSFRHVVKTNIFLTTMADFAAVNEVYARYFEGDKPARSTVAVAGLPRDARVEIEMVATATLD